MKKILISIFVLTMMISGCQSNNAETEVLRNENVQSANDATPSNRLGYGRDKEIRQCLNDIKSGLQNRLDISISNESFDDMRQSYAAAVDKEIESVERYKSLEFEDKEFQTLIVNYISALECEKDAVDEYFFDNEGFKDKYHNQGKDVCVKILQNLMENYNFSVDESYSGKLNKYMDNSKRIALNEMVDVNTEYGGLSVEIEGFVPVDWKKFSDFSDLPDSENVGILKCVVSNKDYYDKYNAGFVRMDECIKLKDSSFISITSSGTSYETGKYEPFAGAFGMLEQGEKKQIAIPYIYDTSETVLYVSVGNEYSLFVPVGIN